MKRKYIVAVPACTLILNAFFVVYFISHPQELPFSFEIFRIISQITSVGIAIPMLYGLYHWLDWKQDWWKVIVMGVYPLLIESIAIVTKFPYSGFVYGDILGENKIFGLVPWTVSLSWTPIFFLSLCLVEQLKISQWWSKVLLGAVYMTLFDLVLDPGATALQFWIWDISGWFYGVPLMNFFGWMVTSILAFGIWYWMFPHIKNMSRDQVYWLGLSGIWSLSFWTGIALWLGYWPIVVGGAVYLGSIFFGQRKY